jgi:hypothetical protein
MGQPWFECKELAEEHGVLALSSNYALYADLSNRVMSILSTYSPWKSTCDSYPKTHCKPKWRATNASWTNGAVAKLADDVLIKRSRNFHPL